MVWKMFVSGRWFCMWALSMQGEYVSLLSEKASYTLWMSTINLYPNGSFDISCKVYQRLYCLVFLYFLPSKILYSF